MRAVIVEGCVKEISEFVRGLAKEKTIYDLEMELFEKTHSGPKRNFFDKYDETLKKTTEDTETACDNAEVLETTALAEVED